MVTCQVYRFFSQLVFICLGLLRVGPRASKHVRGQGRVLNSKIKNHYRLLLRPLRLEGLAAGADVAASISRAGLSMQSGTLPVERHWRFLTSVFPKAQKQLTEPSFSLLSSIAYIRYNVMHFQKPFPVKGADKDSLLQQRFQDFGDLLSRTCRGEESPLKAELQAEYKQFLLSMPPDPPGVPAAAPGPPPSTHTEPK